MRKTVILAKTICFCLGLALAIGFSFVVREERSLRFTGAENTGAGVSVQKEYILNISTKKIHKCTCGTAALIHEENRQLYEGAPDALIDEGYSFCGNCFK